MLVNLSYLEVPIDYQMQNWDNSKLKDNMWMSANPLYKNLNIEFSKLIDIVKSDYRQYSPFIFKNNTKKGENWSNEKQNILILDVDDGLTIQEAMSKFKDFTYLIATTKSHQVDKKGLKCDRFRIILPAINIPKGEEYFKFTNALEKEYPFIDKQVNTKTGAFLGCFDSEYFYNYANTYNCNPLMVKSEKLQEVEELFNKSNINSQQNNRNLPLNDFKSKGEDLPIQEIKSRLTREIVADIISSCGFEVNRKFMFKYRENERTPSASISPDCLIKDFGSELCTDAIGFIQEVKSVDFPTAVQEVAKYVNVQIS